MDVFRQRLEEVREGGRDGRDGKSDVHLHVHIGVYRCTYMYNVHVD